jgi:hypothetical protein
MRMEARMMHVGRRRHVGKAALSLGPAMACGLLFLAGVAHALAVRAAEPPAAAPALLEQGRRIYQEGILPSGAPLRGLRFESALVEGTEAACGTCHRKSGMGSLEGRVSVPPISGRFLFSAAEDQPVVLLDPRAPKNLTRARESYTGASLESALRDGVTVSGRKMTEVMPRYQLKDAEMEALTAYLKQLSAQLSPGVGTDVVRFATVVAPGVDKKRRDVMVEMMRTAFMQRNAAQQQYSGRMRMPLDLVPRTQRNWELDVWELQGAPDTWQAQLAGYYSRAPVFAVVSGISATTWAPVHQFCQQQRLPCMFPSVPLPPSEQAFYALYFSGGVALEAEVLARYLRDQTAAAPRRLVQVYRDDEMGLGAAHVLRQALRGSRIEVEDRVLRDEDAQSLPRALARLTAEDAVILWLRPADLAALDRIAPPQAPAFAYFSGSLLVDELARFPQNWKPRTRLVYPYELGDKRKRNVASLHGWLKTWRLPLVDELFQLEVFFNTLLLTDLSSQMLDNFYRDYLVERAEDMLSWGTNITAYPRLSLAPGQRFASKGAYIARIEGENLKAESDWIVP